LQKIRLYFAFRSPYSRFGLQRVARAGLDAELFPFTGPPEGNVFRDPRASPAVMDYARRDVLRTALRLGLPIAMPDPFEVEFRPANLAFLAAKRQSRGLAFALAVSEARWGRGENVSDLEVLRACAKEAGLTPELAAAAQSDAEVAAELEAGREWIERDQVFGVPFFVIAEGDKEGWRYWGQDRVAELLEDLG